MQELLDKSWEGKTRSVKGKGGQEGVFRSEAPRHRVRIVQPFYLSACEVTQGQFRQVMGQNRSHFGPTGAGRDEVEPANGVLTSVVHMFTLMH